MSKKAFTADQRGVAGLILPFTKMKFSGDVEAYDKINELVSVLNCTSLSTAHDTSTVNVVENISIPLAIFCSWIYSLELARWRNAKLTTYSSAFDMARLCRELVNTVQISQNKPLNFPTLERTTRYIQLFSHFRGTAAQQLMPLDLNVVLEKQFTKLGEQMLFYLNSYIETSTQFNVPNIVMKRVRAKLISQREETNVS